MRLPALADGDARMELVVQPTVTIGGIAGSEERNPAIRRVPAAAKW